MEEATEYPVVGRLSGDIEDELWELDMGTEEKGEG